MRQVTSSTRCAVLLSIALFVNGCSVLPRKAPAAASRGVHHIVFCWLKDPGNTKHRAELIELSKSFADIPGVLSVAAGTSLPSTRPIVDSTFDVAIVMTFPNQSAMQSYLVHPAHTRAVEETLQPLVGKILVYDIVGR